MKIAGFAEVPFPLLWVSHRFLIFPYDHDLDPCIPHPVDTLPGP